MDEIPIRFAKIIALLENKEFWERRIEGLKLLHRIFLEDISTVGFDTAIQLLTAIKIPLKVQLEDLRSQICKDACACVAELARSTVADRGVWEHVSDWFLPPLWQSSCNTIAIVSHSAMEALKAIATIGRVNRNALNSFINACTHKHNVVRRNAFECLLMLLHTVDISILQRMMANLQKVVKAGMSDPVQEARKLSRMCFWGLEKVHEDSAVVMYEGLPPNVQRAIDADKAPYDAWAASFGALVRQVLTLGGAGSSISGPTPSSSGAGNAAKGNTNGGSKRHSTVSEGTDQHRNPPALSAYEAQFDSATAGGGGAGMESGGGLFGGSGSGGNGGEQHGPALRSFLTGLPMQQTLAMGAATNAAAAAGASNYGVGGVLSGNNALGLGVASGAGKGGAASARGAAASTATPTRSGFVSTRPRQSVVKATTRSSSSRNGGGGLSIADEVAGASSPVVAPYAKRAKSATSAGGRASATKGNGTLVGAAALRAVGPAAELVRTTVADRENHALALNQQQQLMQAAMSGGAGKRTGAALGVTSTPHDTWAAIRSQATKDDWSSRSMAFVELSQLLDLNLLPPDCLEEAVVLATEHLLDTHYRVAVSATGAAARLLPKATRECSEVVEAMLLGHITNLGSQKEPLRNAATVQLGALLQTFGATNLQNPLWKIIQTANPGKVRLGAVEFLLHVVQSNKAAFAYSTAIRGAFGKCFTLYKKCLQDQPECAKAVAAVMGVLYSAASDTFAQVVMGLSTADYKAVIKALELVVPHLHQDCQRLKEGSKPYRHPDVSVHSAFQQQLEICSPAPKAVSRVERDLQGFNEYALAAERALVPTFDDGPVHTTSIVENVAKAMGAMASSDAVGGGNGNGNGGQTTASPRRQLRNPHTASPSANNTTVVDMDAYSPSSATKNARFSAKRYDVTSNANTDLGAAQLKASSQSAIASLPHRAASALSQLDAIPQPLQMLMEASQSPYAEHKLSAITVATETLQTQPRLWSGRYRDLLSHLIALCGDYASEVRCAALHCMSQCFSTKYLVPLCVGNIDDALRCAVLSINEHDMAVQQAGGNLLKLLLWGPAALASPSAGGGGSAFDGSKSTATTNNFFMAGSNSSSTAAAGTAPQRRSSYFDPQGGVGGGGGGVTATNSLGGLSSASHFGGSSVKSAGFGGVGQSGFPTEAVLDSALVVLEESRDVLHQRGPLMLFQHTASLLKTALAASFTAAAADNMSAAGGGGLQHQQRQERTELLLCRFVPLAEVAINASHSEVRKQAVIAIVEWYSAIGASLLPHLVRLSTAQLKLISIYYNRQYGHSGAAAGLGGGGTFYTSAAPSAVASSMYGGSTFGGGAASSYGGASVDLANEMQRYGLKAKS